MKKINVQEENKKTRIREKSRSRSRSRNLNPTASSTAILNSSLDLFCLVAVLACLLTLTPETVSSFELQLLALEQEQGAEKAVVDSLPKSGSLADLPLESDNRTHDGTKMKPTETGGEKLTVFCPAKKVSSYSSTNYGQFELPKTPASSDPGTFIVSPCPHGIKNVGAVLIYLPRIFAAPTLKPSISPGLQSYCVLDSHSKMGIWRHVDDLTHLSDCRQQDMEDLVKDVRAVVPVEETITQFNLRQAIPLLNSLLRNAYKDYDSARALVDSVSRLLGEKEIYEDPTLQVLRNELFRLIEQYTQNAKIKPGEKVSVTSSGMSVETALFPSDMESLLEKEKEANGVNGGASAASSFSYDFQTIHLPYEALEMARSSLTTNQQPRLRLIAYSNDLFFHWGKSREWMDEQALANLTHMIPQEQTAFTGEWRVLSMQFDGVTIENLTEPIVYTLPANQPVNNSMRWVCVFWDEHESKWSTRGMKSSELSNGTIQCEANHLTAFSILLDPRPTADEEEYYDENDESWEHHKGDKDALVSSSKKTKTSIHTHILSVLSSIGSALSMTGLGITVLTYALFRCLRNERSNRILLNMSISLFFLHLISLLSEKSLWSHACFVPSFLLHYLLLSSIAWMSVEAVHMYNLLISVFVKPQARFILKRSILAWGIPLLIVTICACVQPEVYTKGRGDWCIMAGHLNYWMYYCAYLTPAALMLAVNTFIFVRILHVLCQQSANMRRQAAIVSNNNNNRNHIHNRNHKSGGDFPESEINRKMDSEDGRTSNKRLDIKSSQFLRISPTQVKGAITVGCLLGIGWTLGFFAFGSWRLVFEYLFCLCNAGQGVLIFLFRVLLHPQASRTWRKALTSFDGRSDFTSFSKKSHSHSESQHQHQNQREKQCQGSGSFASSPTFLSPASSQNNTLTRQDPMSSKLASTLASLLHATPAPAQASISISISSSANDTKPLNAN